MTTPDEMKRAVERMAADLAFCTAHVRLLLSERAELLATVERMRGALIFYADQPPVYPPSFGPWGVGSTDFGHRARAALTTGEANHKDKP